MLGGEGSGRRFANPMGYQGELTLKGVHDFWGDSISTLPAASLQLLTNKGHFVLNRNPLRRSDVIMARLAMISYSGQGKYDRSTQIVYYDELVNDESVLADMQAASTKPPRGQGWWPVVSFELTKESKKRLWVMDDEEEGVKNHCVSCFYQLMSARPDVWVVPFPKK